MTITRRLMLGQAAAVVATRPAFSQDFIGGIPRHQTLIIQGRPAQNADWFNVWAPGGGMNTNGLQQLTTDTFWFINPDGEADTWQNALAADRPSYNADYTEMTVKLRQGIHWSDGVPFTGEDVVFTVQTQIAHRGMGWSAPFTINVADVRVTDPYTVVFLLKAPNARFHTIFTVRWGAAWIMPKHVFENVGDPLRFPHNPPVSLGPYVLHSHDRSGSWVIWRLRDDWQRTSLGMDWGEPAVKYVIFRDVGSPDARFIQQRNHRLDVINDMAPEAMFAMMRDPNATVTAFRTTFPFAHADPTLPSVIFNHQVKPFEDRRVRWALALAINIREVALGAYRGAATLASLAVPPMGVATEAYVRPMQNWLSAFELDTGRRRVKPYDPTMASQIAELVRPAWRDQIPTDQQALQNLFGFGWWKQDRQAATELLQSAGFTRQGNRWMTPEGRPFSFRLQVEGEAIPTLARAGAVIAQQWNQFGIEAKVEVAGPTHLQRFWSGDYESIVHWSVETWGGHPDLSFFLESYHSSFLAARGSMQPQRNYQRWRHPDLDRIIEAGKSVAFDDPKVVELGQDFLKLAVQEMPMIPLVAYNKFAPFDTAYWTGYPTVEDPYSASGPYWSNIRYMIARLKPNPNAPTR